MNRIVAWLKSKNINSHTVVVALIAASGYIVTHPEAQAFLVQAFAKHPKVATELITIAGAIFKYSHSSK